MCFSRFVPFYRLLLKSNNYRICLKDRFRVCLIGATLDRPASVDSAAERYAAPGKTLPRNCPIPTQRRTSALIKASKTWTALVMG
jgi:hypothetical protein